MTLFQYLEKRFNKAARVSGTITFFINMVSLLLLLFSFFILFLFILLWHYTLLVIWRTIPLIGLFFLFGGHNLSMDFLFNTSYYAHASLENSML